MKKLLIIIASILCCHGILSAQQAPKASRILCEDCRDFPFRPLGCNHTSCLEQMLSTATRDTLVNYLLLPTNVADKIVFERNRGADRMADYKKVLDQYEYRDLLKSYDRFVKDRTPYSAPAPRTNVDYATPILFESGKYVIADQNNDILRDALAELEKDPAAKLTIIGTTDNSGDEATNKDLAQKRAEAVKDYLVEHGATPKRITATGRKSSKPTTDKTSADEKAAGRSAYMILKH